MFINKDSVMINNISMGQYLVQVDYSFNKLWSSDSGRNLAGKQTGTLIGVFPKLKLQFRKLTRSELEIIAPILDSATQTVVYYDPTKQTNVTMTTYTGDYEYGNKNIISGNTKNEGFSCSFIAISKRE